MEMDNHTTVVSFPAVGNSSSSSAPLAWVFLSLAVIPVWILSGNVLVLLAVLCNRSLRNLSNRVIASLAFTDLLLSLLVVPLGVYQLVNGQWFLGFYVCLTWTGSDVILSTASIMHLCSIAIYRFRGIAHPLHLRRSRHRRHVAALVVPAWTIAVALSVPFVVQGVLDRSNVLQALDLDPDRLQCGFFNQTFAVYSSLVSFFLPLAVMIFADFRSIQILRSDVKLPVNCNKIDAIDDVTETTSVTCRSDASSSFKAISTVTSLALPTTSPQMTSPQMTSPQMDRKPKSVSRGLLALNDVSVTRGRKRSKSMVYLNMLASGGSAKVNGRERRAEKTLLWVFAAFVALWLPFFCTNLTFGLCGKRCHIPEEMFQVFSWLGYLSSGVNPCIYTLLNRDFRNAFRNLLTCRRKKAPIAGAALGADAPGSKRQALLGS